MREELERNIFHFGSENLNNDLHYHPSQDAVLKDRPPLCTPPPSINSSQKTASTPQTYETTHALVLCHRQPHIVRPSTLDETVPGLLLASLLPRVFIGGGTPTTLGLRCRIKMWAALKGNGGRWVDIT